MHRNGEKQILKFLLNHNIFLQGKYVLSWMSWIRWNQGWDYEKNHNFIEKTPYSQVSIKQASSLNYFEEIFHPARSY